MSGGFDHDPTPEEARASLSYLMGFTDALFYGAMRKEVLLALYLQVLQEGPAVTGESSIVHRIAYQASELYDELGADPDRWQKEVPRGRLLQIDP